jgi:hypothetical protein
MKFPKHIQKAIEEYRLQHKTVRQPKLRIPPRDVLEELYWRYALTQRSIGTLFGVVETTVYYWFRKYDIETRSPRRLSKKSGLKEEENV